MVESIKRINFIKRNHTKQLQQEQSFSSVNQRLWQFDVLKAFAIFLVIWGHAMQQLSDIDYRTNPCFLIIYSFHMPLFMCISGFFATKIRLMRFNEILLHRSCQLLIPALSWGLIVFVTEWFLFKVGIATSYEPFIKARILGGLWFLKSALICTILAWIAYKFKSMIWGVISTFIVSQAIIWFDVMVMYPCFLLGMLIQKKLPWLKNHLGVTASVIGVFSLIGVIYLSFINQEIWHIGFGIKKALQSSNLLSSDGIIFIVNYAICRYLRMLIGMGVSITLICIILLIKESCLSANEKNVLSFIGMNTLAIYTIQTVLLEIILHHTFQIKGVNIYIFDLIISPLLSCAVLCMCLYIKKLTMGGLFGMLLYGICRFKSNSEKNS